MSASGITFISSVGTGTNTNTATTTVTVVKPTCIINDVLIVAIFSEKTPTISLTGWVPISQIAITGTSGPAAITTLYRIVDGSEGSTLVFNTGSVSTLYCAICTAFRGVRVLEPIGDTSTDTTATSTTITGNAVTVQPNDACVVWVGGCFDKGSFSTITVPTNSTDTGSVAKMDNSASKFSEGSMGYNLSPALGDTGTADNNGTASASDNNGSQLIVLLRQRSPVHSFFQSL